MCRNLLRKLKNLRTQKLKNKIMEKYLRPIILAILYPFSLLVAVIVVMAYLYLFHYESIDFTSPDDMFGKNYLELISSQMVLVNVVSAAISLFFAWSMKMLDFKKAFDFKKVDWKNAWIPVVGTILFYKIIYSVHSLFGVDLIRVNATFLDTFAGFFAMSLLIPIIMTLIFYESIMRCMYDNGATNRQAIIFPAICLTLLSVTRLSSCVALFLCSILDASIYAKTRNVVLLCIITVVSSLCSYGGRKMGIDFETFPKYMDFLTVLIFSYPCYRLLRSFFKDEPLIPSILWFKMKRMMVKVR